MSNMATQVQQAGSRKRRAPGELPFNPEKVHDIRNSPSPTLAQLSLAQQHDYNGGLRGFNGSNPNHNAIQTFNSSAPDGMPKSPSMQQVARWQQDNQTVAYNNSDVGYTGSPTSHGPVTSETNRRMPDELDQQAANAEREALSKRKQIPPFVQKLSSFLNENTQNTDLIRWSNDGNSFIVVDEDEFAKTLIPELFKHNNYASFVRQLNMYGFHKKVGLSDNSMRASERKNKNPSEYSNPYFKRGRPNLLWLIHKPKNAPNKIGPKAKQEDTDEVDEIANYGSPGPGNYADTDDINFNQHGRQPLLLGNGSNPLPPDQFVAVQRELAEIRHRQSEITKMLQATRQQQFEQARQFHELHTKHDTTINAILTFLATVYQKTLDGRGMDINNMFGPNTLPNMDQARGNIVDVGDDKYQSSPTDKTQPFRRQPLLLKDGKANTPPQSASTPQSYDQWTSGGNNFYKQSLDPQTLSPAIQELPDHTPSNRSSESPPSKSRTASEANTPGTDIMSMINSANAQNTDISQMQFPEALSHLQNTNGQLTPDQRQNMLQLMSNQPGQHDSNNALASYNPSNNLQGIQWNEEQLEEISRQLQEQGERMASLNTQLAPLSPSGSIPGVTDQSLNPNNAQDLDFDTFLNENEYFPDNGNDANFDFPVANDDAALPDFDFNVTNPGGNDAGNDKDEEAGSVQTVTNSSEAPSPANAVDGWGESEQTGWGPRKLRKRGSKSERWYK